MTIPNKLIILREEHNYSQQQVADAISVSKSTYSRYESGLSELGVKELDALLRLYDINYNQFMDIEFPIVREIIYPEKVIRKLEKEVVGARTYGNNYRDCYAKYNRIKEAMEPILMIREKAMDFPQIDVSKITPGTTVKEIKLDLRVEKLIDEGLKMQEKLFDEMIHIGGNR